jgi:hypothetical protein
MGVYNDATGSTPIEGSAMIPATPDCAANPSQACAGFGVRVQLFAINPGPNPNWQFFAFDPLWDTDANGLVTQSEVIAAVGPGWHRFEATIAEDLETTGHDITVTVDLLADGMNNAQNSPGVDATLVMNDFVEVTQAGFNSLRLGGPSGLPSTGEVSYDNIYLSGPRIMQQGFSAGSAVPEPSMAGLALLGFTAIGLFMRRGCRLRDS